jgi:hypothetical protein
LVVVQDHSSLARQMLRFAQASPRIHPQLVTADEGEARAAVLRGEVMGYALLPRDLKRDVLRRANVVIPVYANGAYPLVSKQVQYGFAEAFGTVSAGVEIKRLQAGGQSAPQAAVSRSPVNAQAVALFNPTEGYGSFVVAAVSVLILQQTLLMGSALLVGTWREQGADRVGSRQWLARLLALCVPGWLAGLFYFGWIFIWQDFPHGGNPWGALALLACFVPAVGLRLPAGLVAGRSRAGPASGAVFLDSTGVSGRLHLARRGLARAAAVAALAVAQYGGHRGLAALQSAGCAFASWPVATVLAGHHGSADLGGRALAGSAAAACTLARSAGRKHSVSKAVAPIKPKFQPTPSKSASPRK